MRYIRRRKWMVIWDWPKDKMSWFFWGYRGPVFDKSRVWRIGPISVWKDD